MTNDTSVGAADPPAQASPPIRIWPAEHGQLSLEDGDGGLPEVYHTSDDGKRVLYGPVMYLASRNYYDVDWTRDALAALSQGERNGYGWKIRSAMLERR